MNEVQINKIKKRADEYATSCFPYEEQFLEREAVVKCCVHVVTETIAELEKENAELKKACDETQNLLDKQIEATYKLDKENAELKEKLECAERARDYWKDSSFDWRHKCTSRKPFKVAVKAQEQLTKAKEHIKKLLDCLKQDTNDPQTNYYVVQYMTQAEQFLLK